MKWTDWHTPLSSGNITLRQGLERPAEKSVHGNMKFHSSADSPAGKVYLGSSRSAAGKPRATG